MEFGAVEIQFNGRSKNGSTFRISKFYRTITIITVFKTKTSTYYSWISLIIKKVVTFLSTYRYN